MDVEFQIDLCSKCHCWHILWVLVDRLPNMIGGLYPIALFCSLFGCIEVISTGNCGIAEYEDRNEKRTHGGVDVGDHSSGIVRENFAYAGSIPAAKRVLRASPFRVMYCMKPDGRLY